MMTTDVNNMDWSIYKNKITVYFHYDSLPLSGYILTT